ncbi:MAG: Ycf51 family protein [Nostoc sp. DedQUE08]|uniref:Ycf51 family protein n=1 Tax=unclassified Nostoc TaxID=2593658 RepID=UPI002AD59F69|nr:MULTISPECIES: Ycf51 family protein [unclassified Nostoc]MDZ8068686.1 Ycf51 family protein [Nostoc sp. DedQUE08]MDZ8094448.1 Ycf51 family protein [Nostoc sp. DedQUE05]MDZ8133758.1 Ycf51 family protein [Nostoc sp. DedQUE04]
MLTTANFFQYTQWSGIATLVFAALTFLAFILKWGIRFRLVGTTGFMLVVTAGLFGLSIVPLSRTVIPGAARYTLVYDNGSTQAVIATSPQITPTQLEATLRQAASNLFSYGRSGTQEDGNLTVRARTIIHPETGISVPVYLGEVKRSLVSHQNSPVTVKIYTDNFAKLPKPTA